MLVTVRLTDFQLAVFDGLPRLAGLRSPSELATAALAGSQIEPRWATARPRPPAPVPGAGQSPGRRLDATLPAACGVALALSAGERLRIVQLKDGQCVDLRAWEAGGRTFSAARTRAIHGLHPSTGASLWSTAPEVELLTIVADSCPGHDLAFPPCSAGEYERHTGIPGHAGCAELHAEAAARARQPDGAGDDVLNLWLPSAVDGAGRLRSWPVKCRRGDHVELRARRDVTVTLSTCPDDLFGSSQYEPGPVGVIVSGDTAGPSGTVRTPPGWPRQPPSSALARHPVAIEVSDADVVRLDQIARLGWLGGSRAATLRALIFRLHESLVGDVAGGPAD
jgi:uncharacterized protein YcgI (DUF1989 family)